jgi:regulator of replication initiation timing
MLFSEVTICLPIFIFGIMRAHVEQTFTIGEPKFTTLTYEGDAMSKKMGALFILSLCVIGNFSFAAKGRASFESVSEDAIYKKVYDHYSDILEDFYAYEKADYLTKDYYLNKMLSTIVNHVRGTMLPLYGNFFSNLWRKTTAYSDNTMPLKKFDTLLIEDALGHLHKHYPHNESVQVIDLTKSLNYIRQLVKKSLEYRYEDLLVEKGNLENKLSMVKRELRELQLECEKLRSKLSAYNLSENPSLKKVLNYLDESESP